MTFRCIVYTIGSDYGEPLIREAGEGDTQAGKASFHSLRATFISMMDEAGAPQAVTDSITGHAPQTMHARYSHPDTEAARNWMEKALPRLDTHLDTVKASLATHGEDRP